MRSGLLLAGLACFGVLGPLSAQEDASRPGPEHEILGALAGDWTVTIASLEASGPHGRASARMRLDGRFLEITLAMRAGPVRDVIYTFAFDRRHDEYAVVMMDDAGTYFVTARGTVEGDRIAMYGKDDDPVMSAMGFEKEFAIALTLHSDTHVTLETIFIDTRTPERKEIPFVAFDLRR